MCNSRRGDFICVTVEGRGLFYTCNGRGGYFIPVQVEGETLYV